jgi:predicted O-linked N-acetylglucosamine transferase (SPINDLY family)
LLALRQGLKAQFPLAYVHPTMNYSEYMGLLSKAAVILQSFPFGGTNTAMDALALGIPLVCLDGDDLAAKVDPLLLRRAGLAELCASSPADYLAITTRLLNSSQERDRIREVAKAGLATLKAQDPLGQTTMADAVLRAWQARATGTAPVTGKA